VGGSNLNQVSREVGISRRWRRALVPVVFLLLPLDALAGQIVLQWDPSPTGGVTYNVYWGTSSGNHPNVASSGTQTSYTVTGLTNGVTYYFVVRAVAGGGALSGPSNEVSGQAGSSISFSEHPLQPGVHTMKLQHMTELRNAINAARGARGAAPITNWTPIAAGTLIRASHITELRGALTAEYTARSLPAPIYVDSSLTAGTPIKALHIMQLRTFVIPLIP
jgi:hypothetical protein